MVEKENRQLGRNANSPEKEVNSVLNKYNAGAKETETTPNSEGSRESKEGDKKKVDFWQPTKEEEQSNSNPFKPSDGEHTPLEAQGARTQEEEIGTNPGLMPSVEASDGSGASELEKWANEHRAA